MRNFWIECEIDGYKTKLKGGPRSKDGGFNLTVYQRSEGVKTTALRIIGWTNHLHGDLVTKVYNSKGNVEFGVNTKR